MFINDEECEFNKYKRFSKIGEYTIKLKFNIFLKDTHCMFLGCKHITKIDLSSLITKHITNMSSMFRDCINLTNINLSSFMEIKGSLVQIREAGFFFLINAINNIIIYK